MPLIRENPKAEQEADQIDQKINELQDVIKEHSTKDEEFELNPSQLEFLNDCFTPNETLKTQSADSIASLSKEELEFLHQKIKQLQQKICDISEDQIKTLQILQTQQDLSTTLETSLKQQEYDFQQRIHSQLFLLNTKAKEQEMFISDIKVNMMALTQSY